ncbi:TPA: hypothetical protein DDW35_06150 [Candidatus Sumerlaeota bacterium]|jgi:zinc protease|nr:hypothetical protein [Candidatus Sumerlaeota bacterium]
MPPLSSQSPIHIEKLQNKLTVLVIPRPGVGVITADLWVNVGSADETPAVNGASHFLEHMLFKGAGPFGVGEIDCMIEGIGGVLNAATSHDFTQYYMTAASANLPVVLRALAQMAQNAHLNAEDVDSERQVILEEYSIKQDNPQGVLWEELYYKAFEHGPYRLPILGTPETLANIGQPELKNYYERHYTPENMTLMLVGDIEPARAVDLAREAFGDFTRPYRPLIDRSKLTTQYASAGEHVIEKDANDTYGMLAVPAPALCGNAREICGLDVMQYVVGGGEASVLYQEVKEKRRLATSIDAGYSHARHPDLFAVYFTCDDPVRAELTRSVLEIFDRAAQEKPTPAALHRARKLLANTHAFSLETTGGMSGTIGYYYTITNDVKFEREYMDTVLDISAEEVQSLAQKYLAGRQPVQVAVRPKKG